MNCRLLLALILLPTSFVFSQRDSVRRDEQHRGSGEQQIDRRKLFITASVVGMGYTTSMVVLSQAWYNNHDRESFHFFDDLPEWKQMDKAGHAFSTWQVSAQGSSLLKNCGINDRRSARIASLTGFLITSSIEVLDGFSSGYGASWSDLGANAVGGLGYLAQDAAWGEPRIIPKYSFHFTTFASQRPELLGRGVEEMVKDYNGQTYWLSFDVKKFAPNSKWPAWLNLAGGYGAEEMIFARDESNRFWGYNPYRQYYLSVDLNWNAIPTNSKFLKSIFAIVNMVKFPAPALEFSKKGMRVHALYF